MNKFLTSLFILSIATPFLSFGVPCFGQPPLLRGIGGGFFQQLLKGGNGDDVREQAFQRMQQRDKNAAAQRLCAKKKDNLIVVCAACDFNNIAECASKTNPESCRKALEAQCNTCKNANINRNTACRDCVGKFGGGLNEKDDICGRMG